MNKCVRGCLANADSLAPPESIKNAGLGQLPILVGHLEAIGQKRFHLDYFRMVGNPYLGIIFGLPVITDQ
jgi:hypothetical protein